MNNYLKMIQFQTTGAEVIEMLTYCKKVEEKM